MVREIHDVQCQFLIYLSTFSPNLFWFFEPEVWSSYVRLCKPCKLLFVRQCISWSPTTKIESQMLTSHSPVDIICKLLSIGWHESSGVTNFSSKYSKLSSTFKSMKTWWHFFRFHFFRTDLPLSSIVVMTSTSISASHFASDTWSLISIKRLRKSVTTYQRQIARQIWKW